MGDGVRPIQTEHLGGRHQRPHAGHAAQRANLGMLLHQPFPLLIQAGNLRA